MRAVDVHERSADQLQHSLDLPAQGDITQPCELNLCNRLGRVLDGTEGCKYLIPTTVTQIRQ